MASKPEKTLKRVLYIAQRDGRSVVFVAGLSTFVSLCGLSWLGIIVGGLVMFAGFYELRGKKRLLAGDIEGMTNLVRAQLLILATVWVYAIICLVTFNEAETGARLAAAFGGFGMSGADMGPQAKRLNDLTYYTVLGVTLLFQGGLAAYYNSRRPIIAQALAANAALKNPPSLPPVLPSA